MNAARDIEKERENERKASEILNAARRFSSAASNTMRGRNYEQKDALRRNKTQLGAIRRNQVLKTN